MGSARTWVTVYEVLFVQAIFALCSHIGSSFIVKRDADPYFLKTPSNISVHEGELAVLKCHVEHLGPKMVSVVVWRKLTQDFPLTIGKMTFSPDDEMSIDHEQLTQTRSRWDLLIKNVKLRHAGTYECQVSANHLIAQYVTLNVLKVKYAEPELKITGDRFVNMGSKIHLICNATGVLRAPEEVDWFLEGNRIVSSNERWRGRVEIWKRTFIPGKYFISELIIEKSTMADKGNYVCRTSDLNVNSINVLVLDTGKEKPKRRDSETKEQKGGEMRKSSTGSAASPHQNSCVALAFVITLAIMVGR